MAQLKAKQRNALPASEFALPTQRKYPINDARHAANAKSRATQMEHRGVISESTKEKIVAKANRKLHGGEMKHVSEFGKHQKHGVGAEKMPRAGKDDYGPSEHVKVPEETVDTPHGHIKMALESHGKTHHPSKARKVGPHPLAKHFDNHEKR